MHGKCGCHFQNEISMLTEGKLSSSNTSYYRESVKVLFFYSHALVHVMYKILHQIMPVLHSGPVQTDVSLCHTQVHNCDLHDPAASSLLFSLSLSLSVCLYLSVFLCIYIIVVISLLARILGECLTVYFHLCIFFFF